LAVLVATLRTKKIETNSSRTTRVIWLSIKGPQSHPTRNRSSKTSNNYPFKQTKFPKRPVVLEASSRVTGRAKMEEGTKQK
jgi:hypothetical protein